jgi:hypothetical protein
VGFSVFPPPGGDQNGAKEKSIRDLKAALDQRLQNLMVSSELARAVAATVHELNHQPRRCLQGRTACAVFHDNAQRRRWSQSRRQEIFRLLLGQFGAMIEKPANGDHLRPATLWRVIVESWFRCQGLINVRHNQTQNVSTTSCKIWSHN